MRSSMPLVQLQYRRQRPSYGGPFEYATHIGESLLSLVQRLEQFQDLDPFRNDAVSVKNVQAIVKNDWKNLMTELGLDEDDYFRISLAKSGTIFQRQLLAHLVQWHYSSILSSASDSYLISGHNNVSIFHIC